VGKPSRNAAQPCAVYEDPYRGDELRDGWAFRVGTWNVESLIGRSMHLRYVLHQKYLLRTLTSSSICKFDNTNIKTLNILVFVFLSDTLLLHCHSFKLSLNLNFFNRIIIISLV